WATRGVPAIRDRRTHFAGRWSMVVRTPADRAGDHVEAQVRILLRRYGVIARRVLTREVGAAPWRELVRVCRRLEARGEVRGGRFVSGLSGEQFALPEAVEMLRQVRRSPASGRVIVISTADPLNLAGIVTAGERVRAVGRNRIAYRDGVPIAVREGETFRLLGDVNSAVDTAVVTDVSRALGVRRAVIA